MWECENVRMWEGRWMWMRENVRKAQTYSCQWHDAGRPKKTKIKVATKTISKIYRFSKIQFFSSSESAGANHKHHQMFFEERPFSPVFGGPWRNRSSRICVQPPLRRSITLRLCAPSDGLPRTLQTWRCLPTTSETCGAYAHVVCCLCVFIIVMTLSSVHVSGCRALDAYPRFTCLVSNRPLSWLSSSSCRVCHLHSPCWSYYWNMAFVTKLPLLL